MKNKTTTSEDWLMDGDWFDCDGLLFIIPKSDVIAEIEGPDGILLDSINAACRDHGEITDLDCEKLGLTRVPDCLKRWDKKCGYYHAQKFDLDFLFTE